MLKFVVGNKYDLIEDVNSSADKNEIVTDKMLREFALSNKAESMKVSAGLRNLRSVPESGRTSHLIAALGK